MTKQKRDCSWEDRMTRFFLRDELSNRDLTLYLDHMDSCQECREELTIQFLVETGIQRLEGGKTFHLNRELEERISLARHLLRKRRRLEGAALAVELVAGLCSIFLLVLLFLFL